MFENDNNSYFWLPSISNSSNEITSHSTIIGHTAVIYNSDGSVTHSFTS